MQLAASGTVGVLSESPLGKSFFSGEFLQTPTQSQLTNGDIG